MGSRFRCRVSPTGVPGCIGANGTGGSGEIGPPGPPGPPGGENLVAVVLDAPATATIPVSSTQTIATIVVDVGADEAVFFTYSGFAAQEPTGDGLKTLSTIMNSSAGFPFGGTAQVSVEDVPGTSKSSAFAAQGGEIASGTPITYTLDATVGPGVGALSVTATVLVYVVKRAIFSITS